MIEKEVLIQSKNGSTLHGVLYLHTDNSIKESIVIMSHGFTGDKYEWGRFPEMARRCNQEGYDALIFDFSGSGENKREPITITRQFNDLESVYEWTRSEGYKKIAVLGLSLGGLTTLGAKISDVDAYVFWAPVTFLHTTDDQTSWFKDISNGPVEIPTSGEGGPIVIDLSFVIEFGKFRVKPALKSLDKPVLVVQGTKDESVPHELTRKAFKFFPENKRNELIEIEGAGHDFEGEHLEKFIDTTIQWLKKNF
jgi:pimeloyl-ACP methyl ester carboxylesterase